MNEVGRSKSHAWLVNGALVAIALLSLAPLAWMVSVSFMPRGEASHFPPPFLPSLATLAVVTLTPPRTSRSMVVTASVSSLPGARQISADALIFILLTLDQFK